MEAAGISNIRRRSSALTLTTTSAPSQRPTGACAGAQGSSPKHLTSFCLSQARLAGGPQAFPGLVFHGTSLRKPPDDLLPFLGESPLPWGPFVSL